VNLPLCNPETVGRLKRLVANTPGATTRAMFGQTACFIGGQMAGGTWGSTFMIRLSPEDRARADALGFALFDPVGGRPQSAGMSQYRVLPVDLVEAEVMVWFCRAFTYTEGLPAKPARPARRGPAPKARKR
jgi:hypothetical protein